MQKDGIRGNEAISNEDRLSKSAPDAISPVGQLCNPEKELYASDRSTADILVEILVDIMVAISSLST